MGNRNAAAGESLDAELARLKRRSGTGEDYEVRWIPRTESAKEGEVVGNTIYVYSIDYECAVRTLQHEFLDAMVSDAARPYLDMVNALLAVLSGAAYGRKERTVESLARMLRHSGGRPGPPPEKDPALA